MNLKNYQGDEINLDTNRRRFGGSKTTPRQRMCLAYAWRQHRQQGSGVFMFRVTSMIKTKGIARGRVVGFVTVADREAGITQLRSQGWNHFTLFNDVNARFALQYGRNDSGQLCINR
jgi:hypothetical protein